MRLPHLPRCNGYHRDTASDVTPSTAHAIAHNKVMIIDGVTVLTGSFNFTRAAEERNAENPPVIRDKILADRYEANWHQHEAYAQPY